MKGIKAFFHKDVRCVNQCLDISCLFAFMGKWLNKWVTGSQTGWWKPTPPRQNQMHSDSHTLGPAVDNIFNFECSLYARDSGWIDCTIQTFASYCFLKIICTNVEKKDHVFKINRYHKSFLHWI